MDVHPRANIETGNTKREEFHRNRQDDRNAKVRTLNDELKTNGLSFIVQRSALIVSS